MKATVRFRVFLLASSTLLAISNTRAASLYWSANGTTQGGAGTWDTSVARWASAASGPFSSIWNNSNNDTAIFGGTADSVTLGDNITVGGLQFDTTAYIIDGETNAKTLGFGAASNTIILNNVAAATINGQVGGGGNVVLKPSSPATAGTLTLGLTSTSGWSGTTTIHRGSTLLLNGANRGLSGTTGITLNGGGVSMTNTTTAQGAFDRVADGAPITSNGGTITYTNTDTASNTYAETIGNVSLSKGQLNVVHGTLQSASSGQTLTLGTSGTGLTQSGTASVTFSCPTALDATKNIIKVFGIGAATPANQIIGPWATTGTAANVQTKWAVYDVSGNVLPDSIADTSQALWVNSTTNAWSFNTGTAGTINATTQAAAVKFYGAASTLTLGTGNLETYGLFFSGANAKTVASTGGALTTPAGGGNLFLTAGQTDHTISAPINNNGTDVVTLVSASATGRKITLSSVTSTYSGGTVLNSGILSVTADTNLGASTGGITFNGGQLTVASVNLSTTRTVTINEAGGGIAVNGNNNFTIASGGTLTGSGTLTKVAVGGSGGQTLNFNGDNSGFTGAIFVDNANVNGPSTIGLGSLADTAGSGNLISGNGTSSCTFSITGSTAITLSNRRIQMDGTAMAITNGSATANTGVWTINSNLIANGSANKTLTLTVRGGSTNTFAGSIGDPIGGGSLSISKGISGGTGNGIWDLSSPNNTFTGTITIGNGTLSLKSFGASGGTIQIGGNGSNIPTLTYTGAALSTSRQFTVGYTGNNSGGVLNNNGTGALTFTAANLIAAPTGNASSGIRPLTLGGTYTGGVNELQGAIAQSYPSNVLYDISITKAADSSQWKLSGNNSFGGAVAANAGGLLQLGNSNALGYGAFQTTATNGTTVASGGVLDLNGQSTINEPITINGTGVSSGGALINNSGTTAIIGNGVAGARLGAAATGSGYSTAPTVTFSGGGGSGAAASTTLGVTVASFTINGGTTVYSAAPTVTISGGGGGGATATAVLTGGVVSGINITNAGYNFTTAPTIAFSGGTVTTAGTNPTGTGNASNFTVSGIKMTNPGSGYTSAPTYTFDSGNAVPGTVDRSLVTLATNSSIGGSGNITVNANIVETGTLKTLTKVGSGTLTLAGVNTYTGATTVSQGTLALAGGSQTSAITVSTGASLGFTLGSPTTSTSPVDLTNGTVKITGTVDNASDYLLMTTSTITGTPALAVPIANYQLQKAVGDTQLKLVYTGVGSPYSTWSGGAAFDVDTNGDGVKNGLAWVLGATDKDVVALGLLPTIDNSDPTYFIFNYRRKDDANTDANTTISAQYGTNLGGWTTAVHDGTNIIITPTDNFYSASPGVDKVEVKIKRTLAVGGKLFVRLNVVQTP